MAHPVKFFDEHITLLHSVQADNNGSRQGQEPDEGSEIIVIVILILIIMGQYYGEMLAETGSFDVLFWYWVLGIGVYTYIHII